MFLEHPPLNSMDLLQSAVIQLLVCVFRRLEDIPIHEVLTYPPRVLSYGIGNIQQRRRVRNSPFSDDFLNDTVLIVAPVRLLKVQTEYLLVVREG